MNANTFSVIVLVFCLSIFAVIIIHDILQYPKEQQANEEWKAILKEWDAKKRKEREEFDKQSWEARKKRFQQMGI